MLHFLLSLGIFVVSLTSLEASFWEQINTSMMSQMRRSFITSCFKSTKSLLSASGVTRNQEMDKFLRTYQLGQDLTVTVKRSQQLHKEISPGIKGIPLSHGTDFALHSQFRQDPVFLPRIYTALDHLTGPSDDDYDQFKGSFSFKFHLNTDKCNNLSRYLYWITQYRTFLRINLYQLVPQSDPRSEMVYTRPSDTLFSEYDIKAFTLTFFESMLGEISKTGHVPLPFVKSAASNCLLFGYLHNDYFVKHLRDFEEYQAERENLMRATSR